LGDELSPSELRDEQIVRQVLLRQLEAIIPVADEPIRVSPTHGPRVIAIVGPTGVGKTTTLAKLAATAKLRMGKRVALITCDTYRIAAVEQLRTYANIIGLPLHVVMSPAEMGPAREAVADAGFELDEASVVDTAVVIGTGAGGKTTDDDAFRKLYGVGNPRVHPTVIPRLMASAAASRTSASLAPVRPYRMLYSMESLNSTVSWGTMPMAARSDFWVTLEMSWPSILMAPSVTP